MNLISKHSQSTLFQNIFLFFFFFSPIFTLAKLFVLSCVWSQDTAFMLGRPRTDVNHAGLFPRIERAGLTFLTRHLMVILEI